MFDINRCLVIVRPKQPFFDWVQSVDYDGELTLEEIREDPTAYLVPEFEDDFEQAEVFAACYDLIFEAELESWYTDPELWPEDRDLEMFLQWFDVDFHSLIFDLVDAPVKVVDYGTDEIDSHGSNGH